MAYNVTVTPQVTNVEVDATIQPFEVDIEIGNIPDLDLTTSGDSGASTFDPLTGVLNVPNYTLDGLGGVPETRTLTINGTTQDLSADRTFTIPVHDSVTIATPANGLAIDGNQVLSLALASASANGALSSADWSAFNGKEDALGFTPENVANKTTNLTSPDDTKYPTALAVSTALGGKQNSLGFTPEDVANKSTDVALGTSNTLYPSQGAVKSYVDTGLSGKQDTLTNPVTGTGTSGQVSFWSGTGTQSGSNNLFWDNVNGRLGVGTNATPSRLTVDSGDIEFTTAGTFGLRWANGSRIYEQPTGTQRLLLLANQDRLEFLNEAGNLFLAGFHGANSALPNSIRLYHGVIIGSTYAANASITPSNGLIVQGNTLLNTTTDAGFRLDVNGTTRVQGALSVTTGGASITGLTTIQGTAASDSGQLGTELLTTGSSDASWTGTSFATGYTHVAGSTTTLTSTLAGVVNTFYQITYTVTGRTAGSFTIAFGGQSFAGLTATGAVGPRATTTDTLVITPTSDFNGTIVLSIRVISASSASVSFNSSAGTVTNQIRISSINSNTFYGRDAGRLNTTGVNNTANGVLALQNNTTGVNNTASGFLALQNNTTGFNNTASGVLALQNNTTGFNNTANGRDALFSNTTGVDNTASGFLALQNNTTGNNNTANGVLALQNNTTGFNNTANGRALQNNTTGSNNTASGFLALQNNTTGNNNTASGQNAGRFLANGSTALTIANNSVFIGFDTRANADNETNQIVIGHTAIGLGSNTTVIGNSSTTFGRWWGRLLIGTSTDAGFGLDVNGTARVQGDFTLSDTRNIILSTGTGTKIGTATSQKLGFWNATPIVQPTTGVAGATLVGGGGTTLTDTDTFDGYTLAQIVKALRNMGALA